VTDPEYAAIPAVRWSRLKVMKISPMHYKYALEAPPPATEPPFFRIGRGVHCFVLEADTFPERFVCYRGRRAGKAWDAFQEENACRTILNESEFDTVLGAATAVLTHPVAAEYLHAGLKEATVTWTDAETGMDCKARVDHCGERLVDLKTTANLDLRMFPAAVARLGYREQLAFYSDGLTANGLSLVGDPAIIAVESRPPFDVVVFDVSADDIEIGRKEYRRLLQHLKHCLATDTWPGRAPDPIPLVMPAWAQPYDDGLELVIGEESLRV
jgi:hypothetical protein